VNAKNKEIKNIVGKNKQNSRRKQNEKLEMNEYEEPIVLIMKTLEKHSDNENDKTFLKHFIHSNYPSNSKE